MGKTKGFCAAFLCALMAFTFSVYPLAAETQESLPQSGQEVSSAGPQPGSENSTAPVSSMVEPDSADTQSGIPQQDSEVLTPTEPPPAPSEETALPQEEQPDITAFAKQADDGSLVISISGNDAGSFISGYLHINVGDNYLPDYEIKDNNIIITAKSLIQRNIPSGEQGINIINRQNNWELNTTVVLDLDFRLSAKQMPGGDIIITAQKLMLPVFLESVENVYEQDGVGFQFVKNENNLCIPYDKIKHVGIQKGIHTISFNAGYINIPDVEVEIVYGVDFSAVQEQNGDVLISFSGDNIGSICGFFENIYLNGNTDGYYIGSESVELEKNSIRISYKFIYYNNIAAGDYILECHVGPDAKYTTSLRINKEEKLPTAAVEIAQNEQGDIILTCPDTNWLREIYGITFTSENQSEVTFERYESYQYFYIDGDKAVLPYAYVASSQMKSGKNYGWEIHASGYRAVISAEGQSLNLTKCVDVYNPPDNINITQSPDGSINISLVSPTERDKRWFSQVYNIYMGGQWPDYVYVDLQLEKYKDDPNLIITDTSITIKPDYPALADAPLVRSSYQFSLYVKNTSPLTEHFYYYKSPAVAISGKDKSVPLKAEYSGGKMVICTQYSTQNAIFASFFDKIVSVKFSDTSTSGWIKDLWLPREKITFTQTGMEISRDALLEYGLRTGQYTIYVMFDKYYMVQFPINNNSFKLDIETSPLDTLPTGVEVFQQPNGDIVVTAPGEEGARWIEKIDRLELYVGEYTMQGFYATSGSKYNSCNYALEKHPGKLVVPGERFKDTGFTIQNPQVRIGAFGYPRYIHAQPLEIISNIQMHPKGIKFQQLDNGDVCIYAEDDTALNWLKNISIINLSAHGSNNNEGLAFRKSDFYLQGGKLIVPYEKVLEKGMSDIFYNFFIQSTGYLDYSSEYEREYLVLNKKGKLPPKSIMVYNDQSGDGKIRLSEKDSWIQAVDRIVLCYYADGGAPLDKVFTGDEFDVTIPNLELTIPKSVMEKRGVGYNLGCTKMVISAPGYLGRVISSPEIGVQTELLAPPDDAAASYVKGEGLWITTGTQQGKSWISSIYNMVFEMYDCFSMTFLTNSVAEIHEKGLLIPEDVIDSYNITRNRMYRIYVKSEKYEEAVLELFVDKMPGIESISLEAEQNTAAAGSFVTFRAAVLPGGVQELPLRWMIDGVYRPEFNGMPVIRLSKSAPGSITAEVYSILNPDIRSAQISVDFEPAGQGAPLENIVFAQENLVVPIGQSPAPAYTLVPENPADARLFWSSSNKRVAEVDKSGNITAHSYGSAVITAEAQDGSGVKAGFIVTCAENTPVSSLSFAHKKRTVVLGAKVQLRADILPENASVKNLAWKSSDSSIVQVDAQGYVTARKLGISVITATAEDGSGVSATCQIEVAQKAAESVVLNHTAAQLNPGETLRLSANVLPPQVPQNVQWQSSAPDIAKVDEEGLITAVSPGSAEITASVLDGSGTKSACAVQVAPYPAEQVILSPASAALVAGETLQLTAKVNPAKALQQVQWQSSRPDIAAVDAGGLVKAVSAGTAVITATAAGSSIKAACTVSVTEVAVSSITLQPDKLSLKPGESRRISALVQPSGAKGGIVWTSSNPSAVQVKDGLVTAIKEGTASIRAKASDAGGCSAVCSVEVAAGVTGVRFPQRAVTLAVKKTISMPAIAYTPGEKAAITYTSSRPKVASVSSGGKIKALSAGKTTITARTLNGKKAVLAVTVAKKGAKTLKVVSVSASVPKTLKAGQKKAVTAKYSPSGATGVKASYSSSKKAVATVDACGTITAKRKGVTVITVKAGGKSKRYTLRVK